MWVVKDEDKLVTTLYIKPTDAYNFLRFDSDHPLHCHKGIPFGQFLRLWRICTHAPDFVQKSLIKAKQCPEPDTVDSHSQQIFVTFHPSFKGLAPIVRKN